MNDTEKMLAKQFLLRVRQEGYSLAENPPRSLDGINIDIYRGKTKICTFDDRQLGEGRYISLRVTTDDSTREDIKADYNKLFYTFIHLHDLYYLYDAAEPLRGYDQSLGYRAIMQYDNCTLAVRGGNKLGELEFGTFITGKTRYGNSKTILNNTYFDMECYPLAKLDFVSRSGLLPKEQLVTPNNIKYLLGSCNKTMDNEGGLFNEETRAALGQVIADLEKAQDVFREVDYRVLAMSAQIPQYIEAKTVGVKGIFAKHQIDRSTLPKGLYAYDIQYSRDELKPELLWNSVIGRRFGTVITKKPLPVGEKGYTELKDRDFSLNPEKRYTLKEFQSKNREHER